MSLKSYALTTVSRLQTYLGIAAGTNDALLEIIINSATEWVENYCGRRFKQTTYTELLDSDGSIFLFLKNYPIDETTGVDLNVRDSGQNEDQWSDVASKNYFVDYDSGVISGLNQKDVWAKGIKKYQAIYKAGYDFDNVATFLSDTEAGDLELAFFKLCTIAYNESRSDPRVESERIGSYAVKFMKIAFEDDSLIGAILDKYRKVDTALGEIGPDLT